jgi:diguanylate cyclase (GGDEF)-like protein
MQMEAELRSKNKELETVSRIDPLTGLSNRRDMLEKINYEREKILRSKKPCCFILSDIDNFKKVNDTYGHDFGDYVLTQVGGILKDGVRNQDHVCRWGGEEFLLVLPETDMTGGVVVSQKIQKVLREYQLVLGSVEAKVSLTFGVTLYDPFNEVDETVKRADELLYIGKKNGKDRIEYL